MDYVFHLVFIVLLLGLIIYDCILFTNSIENLGKAYNLQDGATGGILAAIGTALPETVVPLVAVFGTVITGSSVNIGEDIAFGAVLGSPFLLSTAALFVTGISVIICSTMKKRDCRMCANPIVLVRDLKYFAISYSIAVLCAFVPFKPVKYCVAAFLLMYYVWYAKRTLMKDFGGNEESEEIEELIFLKPLKFLANYKKALTMFQVLVSLAGLVILAHLFVEEIKFCAVVLNIHPMVMSLLLAPIATELPECFNSAIWIGASKDTLSVSNVTGALVFQSCIPAAIGISLTPWTFNQPAFVSVLLVYCSLIMVYVNAVKNKGMLNPRILTMCGLFYLIYIAYVLKMLI